MSVADESPDTIERLTKALERPPPIAELASPELAAVLERAATFARLRGHEHVTIDHLFLAMAHDPLGAEILAACGADLDVTRFRLAQAVDRLLTFKWRALFESVLKLAHLRWLLTKKQVTVGHMLSDMMRESASPARKVLSDQGVTRLRILEYVSHGKIHVEPEPLPVATVLRGAPSAKARPSGYEVVLHDDDYTPGEFVTNVLRSIFDMSNAQAVVLAVRVGDHGTGVVGVYELRVALEKIDKATRLARKAEFPLRLSIRPEPGPAA